MSFETLSSTLSTHVTQHSDGVVRVSGRCHGSTTGTVWSEDTVVATAHALDRDDHLTIGVGESEWEAELVGEDPSTDIALLRVKNHKLTPPAWADSDAVRVGELGIALGRPGRTVRARLAMISALSDEWRTPSGGQLHRYIETDIGPQRGFSGGPLVDSRGHVIGITTSGLLRGSNMVVPTETLKRVTTELLAHGRVRRGYLGIGAYPVQLRGDSKTAAGVDTGLLVVAVEPDSPAAKAGVMLGDTLLTLDGKTLESMGDLLAVLGQDRIGTPVAVKLLRAGVVQTLSINVGTRQ